jgi:hypothetical protein
VAAHYDLLEEFGIAAPEEDVAAARCMDVDYGALRDAAWAAEAAKDRQAQVSCNTTMPQTMLQAGCSMIGLHVCICIGLGQHSVIESHTRCMQC